MLISNRYDATMEAVQTYVKRWRIEFFRTAKQELAFENVGKYFGCKSLILTTNKEK